MEPKFVLSKSVVLNQYKKLESFSDFVSYSSKTNQDVTKILEEKTNSFFSVHLANELKHVKDKSRVIFLAQGWNDKFIADLISQNIKWFVVDNETDLDTLEKFLDGNDVKINLLLRLKLKENTLRTEKYYVFGMPSKVIAERIKKLENHPKLDKLGIHFHRKTQNMSEWNLQYELEHIFEKDFWKSISVVNIGGGLPSIYANTNVDVFDGIFDKVRDLKKWFNGQEIKMMIEPGRFIAAPAAKLMTNIIGIHGNTIIVDASVYSGDLDALVVPVKLLVDGELPKGKGISYIIKGVTPCSMDIYRYRCYLPEKKIGDEIIFLNAGAYNFASDFCDLEKLKTEVVE
jgi:ornithine decarboxylase